MLWHAMLYCIIGDDRGAAVLRRGGAGPSRHYDCDYDYDYRRIIICYVILS